MALECNLTCPHCKKVQMVLHREQVAQGSDVFVHVLKTMDGKPAEKGICPECGSDLVRV
jgi:hypothetical protein